MKAKYLYFLLLCYLITVPLKSQENWHVIIDDQKTLLSIVVDHPQGDHFLVSEKIKFLFTCASTYLLHQGYHQDGKSHIEDKIWARFIRWSLESVGREISKVPDGSGKLVSSLSKDLETDNAEQLEKAKTTIYSVMREALFLAWSPALQDLIDRYLELRRLPMILSQRQNLQNEYCSIAFDKDRINFQVKFDHLLLGKTEQCIQQIFRFYYSDIQTSFSDNPSITNSVTSLYPQFVQTDKYFLQNIDVGYTGIKISEVLYKSLPLQYSLWEYRLFQNRQRKIWLALQISSQAISNKQIQIDENKVSKFATNMLQEIQKRFIVPVDVKYIPRDQLPKDFVYPNFSVFKKYPFSNDFWCSKLHFFIDDKALQKLPENEELLLPNFSWSSEYPYPKPEKIPLIKRVGDKCIAVSPKVSVAHHENGYSVEISHEFFCTRTTQFYLYSKHLDKNIDFPITHIEIDPRSIVVYEISGYGISEQSLSEPVRGKYFEESLDNEYSISYRSDYFEFETSVLPGRITSSYQGLP